MRTGPTKRSFGVLLTSLLALGLLLGCGGGDGSSAATYDTAANEAQVKANWETFFSPKGTTAEHEALLENGASLRKAIEVNAKNPLAKTAKTTVTKVVIDPGHTTATVTYDISINGQKVINGGEGQAVHQDGKWKVSKESFCGLAAAGGAAPGCS